MGGGEAMSTEKEDMLLRFLWRQGYSTKAAIAKIDKVKFKEAALV